LSRSAKASKIGISKRTFSRFCMLSRLFDGSSRESFCAFRDRKESSTWI
jgi:hypothetical protein